MYKIIKNIMGIMALALLASCGGEDDKRPSNQLVVAVSADNPPYEFIKDRQIVGMDIDIINEIASFLEKKLVVKNIDFPGLLPALNTKNVDAVISAMTATEKRDEKVDFTKSYMSSAMSVIFHKDNGFRSTKELEGKIVGVQTGSTWEIFARNLAKQVEGMKIRSLSNNLVLVEELKAGSVDALLMEEMQAIIFKNNVNDLEFFILDGTNEKFAIVTPNESELIKELNRAIDHLESTGKLAEIKAKWLK